MSKDTLIEFGSHCHTHCYLSEENEESIIYEFSKSKEILQEIINKKIIYISYPFSIINKKIINHVKNIGYQAGCGLLKNVLVKDIFAIRRTAIGFDDDINRFHKKLSWYYPLIRDLRFFYKSLWL